MDTTKLKISKLDGATDAAHLEKSIEAVPGVKAVRIDPDSNEAVVQHEAGTDPKMFTEALRRQGYISDVV